MSTKEKVKHLTDVYGMPKDRIFNSRDTSFCSGTMRKTANKGVDVVLNSLSGESFHLSWPCLAEFGSFIEFGKRDFLGRGKLNMDVFRSKRAFFGVELGQMCEQRPKMIERLNKSNLPVS